MKTTDHLHTGTAASGHFGSGAQFLLFGLATISLLGVLLMPHSILALLAFSVALISFTFSRCDGLLIVPPALLGVFAPIRLMGSHISNEVLAGPLNTASYAVSDLAINISAIVVYIVVIGSNLLSSPELLRRIVQTVGPLPTSYRHTCWSLILISSTAYVVRSGGIPILQEDAEAARVVAQSGAALLVFLTFVPAVILAIDTASRRHLRQIHVFRTFRLLLLIGVFPLIAGSRLPTLIVVYAFFATTISLRRLQGKATFSIILGATVLMTTIAVAVGAGRASYVGWSNGTAGAIEHFLRRSAADAGNLQVLLDRNVTDLISLPEFVVAPFATYLPGAQQNLGQILKSRLNLIFDGGGITVPMPVEAYAMLGVPGLFIIPALTCLLVTQVVRWQASVMIVSSAPGVWLATSVGFMNIGTGGLFELIATSLVPFACIGVLVSALAKPRISSPTPPQGADLV